jgi:alginate O-acetyltransferase complex protein AlgI
MTVFQSAWLFPVLVLTLVLYWKVLAGQHRVWLLTIVSVLSIASLQPWFALVGTGLAFFCFSTAKIFEQQRFADSSRRLLLALSCILWVLFVGKYGHTLFVRMYGDSSSIEAYFIMPLGLSYLALKLIQYLLDAYRGTLRDLTFGRLAAYLSFLPILPAGPVETYQGFWEKRDENWNSSLFTTGVQRILLGYVKKLFFLSLVFETFIHQRLTNSLFTSEGLNLTHAPLFLASCFVYAYLDLSAYSDLAIGFSALFGFRIVENFRYPFAQSDLSAFWRSWHISLSNWCRNNVYFPVFGLTRRPRLALFASMLVMGLWHHVDFNWTAWAIYHSSGLTFLNSWVGFKKKRPRLRMFFDSPGGTLIGWWITFWFVALGYAFVSVPGIEQSSRVFVGALTRLLQFKF